MAFNTINTSYNALDTAMTGLRLAQKALDVTANNIANASTPGFTKKILPQETVRASDIAFGVRISAITRSVDRTILDDLFRQNSVLENSNAREAFLSEIQQFHGPSDAERSISASIAKLQKSFSDLSLSPDSSILIDSVLTQATEAATKINKFAELVGDKRNQTVVQISEGVAELNAAIKVYAESNHRIGQLSGARLSFADEADRRDQALRTISGYMEVRTFKTENDKLTLTTNVGDVLADDAARVIVFSPTPLSPAPTAFYPGGGASGIFIGDATGVDLTSGSIGGRLGALIELRDETLPQYQAHIDELAQKLAYRFDIEGLTLFTDRNGDVPPTVDDPALVGYVGFANQIQINPDVIDDHTLIRSGTTGASVLEGSTELISKILDYTFGETAYEEGTGGIDLSAGTLNTLLGIASQARVIGTTDITDYTPSLDTNPNIVAGSQFDIIFAGLGPFTITINPGDTATDLVNNINAGAGQTISRLNGLGQLVFETPGDLTINDVSLGAAGIAALGHSFGTTNAALPSFTVRVGAQSPVTITMADTDTSVELLAQLNAVPNLTAILGVSGELILTPLHGGGLTLTDGVGQPLAAMSMNIAKVAHDAFRQNNLGPDGSVSTDLFAIKTLGEFSRQVVSTQSKHYSDVRFKQDEELVYYNTLDRNNSDFSGVNIDEEMSDLIRIQSAYSAAARAITMVEEMFNELLQAF